MVPGVSAERDWGALLYCRLMANCWRMASVLPTELPGRLVSGCRWLGSTLEVGLPLLRLLLCLTLDAKGSDGARAEASYRDHLAALVAFAEAAVV